MSARSIGRGDSSERSASSGVRARQSRVLSAARRVGVVCTSLAKLVVEKRGITAQKHSAAIGCCAESAAARRRWSVVVGTWHLPDGQVCQLHHQGQGYAQIPVIILEADLNLRLTLASNGHVTVYLNRGELPGHRHEEHGAPRLISARHFDGHGEGFGKVVRVKLHKQVLTDLKLVRRSMVQCNAVPYWFTAMTRRRQWIGCPACDRRESHVAVLIRAKEALPICAALF
eukprot:4541209-Pyramimonas_sp.AAC.2